MLRMTPSRLPLYESRGVGGFQCLAYITGKLATIEVIDGSMHGDVIKVPIINLSNYGSNAFGMDFGSEDLES